MLMKEDLHVELKKLKRRNRRIEARVEDSLVATSDRRGRKPATKKAAGKDKGSANDEVETDDDDSELLVSSKSLMLETAENKSKLERLEMALQ
jgi:hypothetical protein